MQRLACCSQHGLHAQSLTLTWLIHTFTKVARPEAISYLAKEKMQQLQTHGCAPDLLSEREVVGGPNVVLTVSWVGSWDG